MASALFGQATTSGSTGVGAELLTALAQARAGVGVDVKAATADPKGPLAPVWTPGVSPGAEALLRRAADGKAFFDANAKLYADLGATGDYRRLFALHTGLSTLQALAGRAGEESLSAAEKTRTVAQFTRGMKELEAFLAREQFDDIRLAQGDRLDAAQTSLALPSKSEDYVTGLVHRGSLSETMTGLASDARFDITALSTGGTERRVSIDLSEMGSVPRSLGNVVSFINTKLALAGASSRLETVDQTPKSNTVTIAGRTITSRYTGPKQYALKVDVRAGERVSFEAHAPEPAFYAVGSVGGGARLIKLQDVADAAGQPTRLPRPSATADPIGAYVSTGWLGAGTPYQSAPAGAFEQRTTALFSDGDNNFENAFRAAGEAVLQLAFADGRTLSLTTAWRADDIETWRQRSGESQDRAIADDVAERLSQLLHEQGVAAGVEVWESGDEIGFSLKTDDFLTVKKLAISGREARLEAVDPPGMTAGLRDGVFARRLEAGAVAASGALFEGAQTFSITTDRGSEVITIDGGSDGVPAATIVARLNEKLRERGIAAAATLYDNGASYDLRFDGLHALAGVTATINGTAFDLALQAPGAWAEGGLPNASAGQPFGDALRDYAVGGASPLLTHTGAVDLEIVVATATGERTVSVSVSAAERGADPDPSPGEWSAAFQARLDQALNAAGVYVDSQGGDLLNWRVAEGAGQRIASIRINGNPLTLEARAPAFALGGAFAAERSFTSSEAATGVSDDVTALLSDQNVSITFATIWGEHTISAVLDAGDPRTLESAALRLNQALAAQGYDLGVAAVALSAGGAGLRVVSGNSHSIRVVTEIELGGEAETLSLDPIDSASVADDPMGTARVAQRASRGAAVFETGVESSAYSAPSVNSGGWFAGRAFDVSIGGGAKVATARAVATDAAGAVYVLADLGGDSATSVIKGARDVALLKYDSAGALLYTNVLGAAQSASGFALAVSASGKVAIAGAIEGGLSGADAAKGGVDSFVTLFDSSGAELWTQRRAASAADEARAIAFTPAGEVIVAGKTNAALGASVALGGGDAYVRGFSASGGELFTRQFGTGGDDAATALHVRDHGSGGAEIFTGGVEGERGVLRRFSYSSANGLTVGATRDIGYFHSGAINAIASDGTSLYVGGEVGAERLDLGAAARAAVAGKEGFVARVAADLASNTIDRASYLGSAQDDSVRALTISEGAVYAAGMSGGVIDGQGNAKSQSAFIARLNASGEADWTRTFNSSAGLFNLNAIAVDAEGASPLDVLGLPRGDVAVSDAGALTARSAARAGDEFRIGVDGRRLTTIRIAAGDTLASLIGTINRAIGGAGRAEIVRENGVERLKITARSGQAVRIEAGREGRDALQALGLKQGVVAVNAGVRGALKTFGLGLVASELKLGTKGEVAGARAKISAALSLVRQAYDALYYPNAKAPTAEEKALEARRQAAGPAPDYMNAQLANYRAALARLTGGS